MDYIALVLAAFSLGLSLWTRVARAPQRSVSELRARVEDLETDLERVHDLLARREKRESMAVARDVHQARLSRQDRVEREALELIEQAKAAKSAPAAPAVDPQSPEGRAMIKADLRRRARLLS